jgi:hypothetical protein
MASAQTTSFAGTEPGLVGYWPMTDVDQNLDGIVQGGITSVSTFAPSTSLNFDFETDSAWTNAEYLQNGDTNWWNPIAPYGNRAMIVRFNTKSQTITGFKPGVPYTLSFYAAQRSGSYGGQTLQFKLDGNVIGTVTPDSDSYKLYRLPDFITDAGSHLLEIVPAVSGDRSAYIDALAFNVGDPIGRNLDFDGSGGWTFENTTAGVDSAIIGNGSPFWQPNAISGSQAAQLRGKMSQTISGFDESTFYTLSFYAANRGGQHSGQTIQIKLGDNVIGTLTPGSESYKLYTFSGISPGTGSHVLSFVSQVSGDKTVYIDSVKLDAVDRTTVKTAVVSYIPQFVNASFETGAASTGSNPWAYQPSDATWTWSGSVGQAKPGGGFLGGGDNPPDGGQSAYFQGSSGISQNISGFADGQLYDLSFKMRGRNGYNQNPMTMSVYMDGKELGSYLNTTQRQWQTFVIRNLSPGAGTRGFTFYAHNYGGGDMGIVLDDIRFAASLDPVPAPPGQPVLSRGPKNSYTAFTMEFGGMQVGLQVYFDGSVNIISGDIFGGGFNRFVQDLESAYKRTAQAFTSAYNTVANGITDTYEAASQAVEQAINKVQEAANNVVKAVVGGLKKAGNAIKKFFNYYVDGSTIYFDPSGIGTYVAGNPMAITGSDGSFEFTLPENPSGQLVGYGGTITATAQPNDAVFTAVATASVVSPLTTLVNYQVRSGLDLSTAVTTIDAALGLPATYDLNANGTMENALQGDEDAALAYAAEVKVYILAQETAALLSGSPGAPSKTVLMTNAFATLANVLQTSNGTYDFTSASNINSLIQATASASNITIDNSLSSGGATVIARLQQAIEGLSNNNATAPGTLEFLQNVAVYQRIAGGSVASQLTAAGNGSISISSVTANVTSTNLTVWAANTTIGNLRPPVLTLVTDANAPTQHTVAGVGQPNYIDFPVTVAGTSSSLLPISVSYSTSDDSAVAARGDYTATNGTLTWAPGDTSTKYIRVPVGTGSLIDISKQFNVTISNPANSILEYTTTVATIDYSIFNTTTTLVTSQSTATAFSP